jgi:hypothetical protein
MHTPTKQDMRTLTMVMERLLHPIIGRPAHVSFALLGDVPFTTAVQTSLYEFDESQTGPKGPMYITLNASLVHDVEELLDVLERIIDAGQ